jgi:hypothetical protein
VHGQQSQGRRLEDVPCKGGKRRDHWAITSLKASRKSFMWAEASEGPLGLSSSWQELPVCQMPHEHGRQGPVGAISSRRLDVKRFSRRESCPKISFDGILIWKLNLGIIRLNVFLDLGSEDLVGVFQDMVAGRAHGAVATSCKRHLLLPTRIMASVCAKAEFCRAWSPGNSQH